MEREPPSLFRFAQKSKSFVIERRKEKDDFWAKQNEKEEKKNCSIVCAPIDVLLVRFLLAALVFDTIFAPPPAAADLLAAHTNTRVLHFKSIIIKFRSEWSY